MRKKMFSLKNIAMIFMALALLTSVGCRKQDDGEKVTKKEVADLQQNLATLKKDLADAKKKFEETHAPVDADNVVRLTIEKLTMEGGKIADLEAELKGLEGAKALIEANKAELQKILDGTYTKEQVDEKLKAMGLAPHLTKLTMLPDYVSVEGGALPLIYLNSVRTNCGTLVPEVLVKYVVSPSNVTEADIDTDKISFRYNDPRELVARTAKDVGANAKFVSLENGVLTVAVTVDTQKLWYNNHNNTESRIDELMLQVPTKDGVVVSSDWAKVVYMGKDIFITNSVSLPTVTKKDILPLTASAAKEPTVVVHDMAWDSTVNLDELVKKYVAYDNSGAVVFESADDYKGLTFEYDLKDEDGNKIVFNKGTNKTDQQEFAKLDGSNFSTRVYSEAPNSAAVGRTPIVHVMLKKGDCTVTEGFIKFNIVEKVIPPVPPITFERVGKTINAECGAAVEAYRVNTEEMNVQFYHKVDMSKEDFHTNYTFVEGEGVGTVNQITDPEDDTSYNLVYTLSQDEVWNNIGKTVSKTATYTYGTSVINMIFKAHIVNEKVVLAAPVDNFWDAEKTFVKHNVAVPQSVNDKDPNHATFENNLNDVFNRVEGEKVLELGDATKYAGYNYEYKFVPVAEQPIKTVTGHKDGVITISVDPTGKELKATQGTKTPETIATITNHTATEGDLLSYNKDSELGKWLLNHEPEFMEARLVLEVTNSCGKNVDVEVSTLKDGNKFNVHFLRPINSASKSPKHFVDGVDFGAEGSYIDVRELLDLSDWRNRIKDTKDYDFLPNHKNYFKFYGVESIEPDHENITVKEGLKVGGKPVTKLPENFQIEFNTTDFTGQHPKGVLSYKNNGFNLENDFTITVPVVVTYKWGKIETSVDVVVKATSKSAVTTNN